MARKFLKHLSHGIILIFPISNILFLFFKYLSLLTFHRHSRSMQETRSCKILRPTPGQLFWADPAPNVRIVKKVSTKCRSELKLQLRLWIQDLQLRKSDGVFQILQAFGALKAVRWSFKPSKLQRRMGGNAGCSEIYIWHTFYVLNRSPFSWLCKWTAHFVTGCKSCLVCSSWVHLLGLARGVRPSCTHCVHSGRPRWLGQMGPNQRTRGSCASFTKTL